MANKNSITKEDGRKRIKASGVKKKKKLEREGASGIPCIEATDTTQHSAVHRAASQQRPVPPRMSTMALVKHWAASFEGSTEIHVAYGPSEEDWSRTRSPVAILCLFPGPENQRDPLCLEILPCFLAFMSMYPAYSEVDDCYSKGGSACRKFGRCTNVDQSANVPSTWRLL